jgi:hypothetical protein
MFEKPKVNSTFWAIGTYKFNPNILPVCAKPKLLSFDSPNVPIGVAEPEFTCNSTAPFPCA